MNAPDIDVLCRLFGLDADCFAREQKFTLHFVDRKLVQIDYEPGVPVAIASAERMDPM